MTHDINTYSQERYGTPTDEQLAARQRWVALLREGKYPKHKHALASLDLGSRCCLGVACDPSVIGIQLEVIADGFSQPNFEGTGESLPDRAQEALGFWAPYPTVVLAEGLAGYAPGAVVDLSALNDGGDGDRLNEEVSHAELADLIELNHIAPFRKEGSA